VDTTITEALAEVPTISKRIAKKQQFVLDFLSRPAVCASMAEAAAVSLDRHHVPPATLAVTTHDARSLSYSVDWTPRGSRERAAWANDTDTTEAAAYAVALAAAEAAYGLFAAQRVVVGGGADYWVSRAPLFGNSVDGQLDLEDAIRLEVSGMDRSESEAALLYRLSKKAEQIAHAGSDPGLAGVVAFDLMQMRFRSVGAVSDVGG
jgi:hypothetical protein